MSIYNKTKCLQCNKKTIYITDCKCNRIFCLRCIHYHNCSFDYKRNQQQKIENENQKVEFEKIIKI
jgi:hypothetical protein